MQRSATSFIEVVARLPWALPFMILLASLGSGCSFSSTITLDQAPSDMILISIVPNNTQAVGYEVRSAIADLFEYQQNTDFKVILPVVLAFRNHIDLYMHTKFTHVSTDSVLSDENINMTVTLSDFEVKYNIENVSTLAVLAGKGVEGDASVNAQIIVNIRITKENNIVSEKNIIANAQSAEKFDSGEHRSVEELYRVAVDGAIEKSIIMIDKFLSSEGL